MKNLLSTLILFLASDVLYAQHSEANKDTLNHRHEFGFDATGFIKQFFNFNSNQFTSEYQPYYYVTYRLYTKKSSFRAGISFNSNTTNRVGETNSQKRVTEITKNFSYRFGYEFRRTISRRWNAFYGLDFRPSRQYQKYYNFSQNQGYFNGTITETQSFGVAPLLGLKYKINPRLCLWTEASAVLNYSEVRSRATYVVATDGKPEKPDDKRQVSYRWNAFFIQPNFINIAYRL